MDIGVISVRYARALLKSATDQQLEATVYKEMMTVAKSYLEVPQLRQTIDNPMLSKDKKEVLLLTAAGPNPCALTKRAARVSPQTEQKMRQMVESKTQGTVEFETEVNPDIIGGFILEYDTYRMDASVKTKLNNILHTLRR